MLISPSKKDIKKKGRMKNKLFNFCSMNVHFVHWLFNDFFSLIITH